MDHAQISWDFVGIFVMLRNVFVGWSPNVDGLRLSTPTNPQDAPPLGWRHDRVVCVVLEFQSGNAILAQVQGTCLD